MRQKHDFFEAYLRRKKLEEDREKLVECLNYLVSSGSLDHEDVVEVDNVLADTIGADNV